MNGMEALMKTFQNTSDNASQLFSHSQQLTEHSPVKERASRALQFGSDASPLIGYVALKQFTAELAWKYVTPED